MNIRAIAVAIACSPLIAHGQTVLHKVEGVLSPSDSFGQTICALGDVDADGVADFLIGAPGRWDATSPVGAAIVYSGATAQVLRTHLGTFNGDRLGTVAINTGDLDGDGVSDYAASAVWSGYAANRGGSLWYYSGASGALIRRVDGMVDDANWGTSLSSVGDVDGDGVPDQVAGTWRSQYVNGYVRVISGATGSTVFTQDEPYPYPGHSYAVHVAGIGDVNGDSIGDIAIGSQYAGTQGGEVRIISGSTGALIRQLASPGGEFGSWVEPAGDVDGDGAGDVLVTAHWASVTGRVYVHSGADGSILKTFAGQEYDHLFGIKTTRCADLDGDGVLDYAISATRADYTSNNSGRVRVFSGQSGAVIYDFDGDDNGYALGYSLASLGDLNGDGVGELAAGQVSQPSTVKIFSGTCTLPAASTYCVGAPNSAGPGASIGYTGSTNISAGNFRLTVSGCPPNKVGLFIYAPNQSQFAWGNGFKCVSGDYTRRILPAVLTDATGSGSLLVNFSTFPTQFAPGANPKFQFWYRDPPSGGAGFNFSDALSVSFCP